MERTGEEFVDGCSSRAQLSGRERNVFPHSPHVAEGDGGGEEAEDDQGDLPAYQPQHGGEEGEDDGRPEGESGWSGWVEERMRCLTSGGQ